MYKEITENELMKAKVNIDLVDGTEILGKDIAPNQNPEALMTFWEDENSLGIIPLHQIKRISYYFED